MRLKALIGVLALLAVMAAGAQTPQQYATGTCWEASLSGSPEVSLLGAASIAATGGNIYVLQGNTLRKLGSDMRELASIQLPDLLHAVAAVEDARFEITCGMQGADLGYLYGPEAPLTRSNDGWMNASSTSGSVNTSGAQPLSIQQCVNQNMVQGLHQAHELKTLSQVQLAADQYGVYLLRGGRLTIFDQDLREVRGKDIIQPVSNSDQCPTCVSMANNGMVMDQVRFRGMSNGLCPGPGQYQYGWNQSPSGVLMPASYPETPASLGGMQGVYAPNGQYYGPGASMSTGLYNYGVSSAASTQHQQAVETALSPPPGMGAVGATVATTPGTTGTRHAGTATTALDVRAVPGAPGTTAGTTGTAHAGTAVTNLNVRATQGAVGTTPGTAGTAAAGSATTGYSTRAIQGVGTTGVPTGFGTAGGTATPTGFGTTVNGRLTPAGFGTTVDGRPTPRGFGTAGGTVTPTGFGTTIDVAPQAGFGTTRDVVIPRTDVGVPQVPAGVTPYGPIFSPYGYGTTRFNTTPLDIGISATPVGTIEGGAVPEGAIQGEFNTNLDTRGGVGRTFAPGTTGLGTLRSTDVGAPGGFGRPTGIGQPTSIAPPGVSGLGTTTGTDVGTPTGFTPATGTGFGTGFGGTGTGTRAFGSGFTGPGTASSSFSNPGAGYGQVREDAAVAAVTSAAAGGVQGASTNTGYTVVTNTGGGEIPASFEPVVRQDLDPRSGQYGWMWELPQMVPGAISPVARRGITDGNVFMGVSGDQASGPQRLHLHVMRPDGTTDPQGEIVSAYLYQRGNVEAGRTLSLQVHAPGEYQIRFWPETMYGDTLAVRVSRPGQREEVIYFPLSGPEPDAAL